MVILQVATAITSRSISITNTKMRLSICIALFLTMDTVKYCKLVALEVEEKDETQFVGAPSELRVYASHDSVQVSWLPPRDENVMIRGYQIGWGIGIPDTQKAIVDPSLRQYTIEDLKPNREYVISLRALNKIGQGFPIYETVKTSSYGRHLTESPPINFDSNSLTPVGLISETISSTQIRLSWVDPNEAFNQFYTIKYGQSGETNDKSKELNTSDSEHLFEGLKADTQYEFAVKLANSREWSLTAINRTFPAAPSSPPRDLTVIGPQTKEDDPSIITLNWQPPKYANGEVKEYIILYTNKLDAPEREWMMSSVEGDRLSVVIRGLFPKTTYHFKVQARNVKGYGPFSSIVSIESPAAQIQSNSNLYNQNIHFTEKEQNASFYDHTIMQMLKANFAYILLGIVTIILLALIIGLIIFCSQRKTSNSKRKNVPSRQYYIPGRKQSNCAISDDLWIHQNDGRFAAVLNAQGTIEGITYENNFDLASSGNDARQRILLVDHQQRALISESPTAHFDSHLSHYQSHYDAIKPHQVNTKEGIRNSCNFPSQSLIETCQSVYCGLSPKVPRGAHYRHHRNSLPPRICPSTSMSPATANKSRKIDRDHFIILKSDSPASYDSFCPDPKAKQHSLSTFATNEGNPIKSSSHSISKQHETCNAKCTKSSNDGLKKAQSGPTSDKSHQSAENNHSGIVNISNLTVRNAKRTSTADYGHEQQKNLASKCVNFASNLVTVGADDVIGFIDDNNTFGDEQKIWEKTTLSRNYHSPAVADHFHQSPATHNHRQTPTTPRNPHIVYARADRQPITKVEIAHQSSSPFHDESGSFTEIRGIDFDKSNSQLTPSLPEVYGNGGYQQIAQNPSSLCSFSPIDNKRGVAEQHHQQKVAHVVRPIVATNVTNCSPSTTRNVMGQPQQQKTPPLMGQKFAMGKVPVGRATAQPRVNIASESPSPYSSVRVNRTSLGSGQAMFANGTTCMQSEQQKMHQNKSDGSVEDLNVQEIDQMIDTLQQLQHEFTNADA